MPHFSRPWFPIVMTSLVGFCFAVFFFQRLERTSLSDFREPAVVKFTNYKTVNAAPTSLPEDFVAPSRKVTPAVVNIIASAGGYRASGGSGVIISDDGYIVTNHHVVEGARSFTVSFSDKQEASARLIGSDPTTDLALLKVDARGLDVVEWGNSDNIQVGEWVLAVGNPFNLASTVTAGIVSAKGRNINIIGGEYSIESFIQTDAVVNPGNSGGALVNARGQLVGINTAILSESGGYEGYSFAIPANLARKVIADLREFGSVQRAILGVRIRDVDPNLAERLDLPSVDGVYITDITPGSSAASAGLRSEDVIVAINDRQTRSTAELQEQIARYRPGDRVDVSIYREGRRFMKEGVRLKKLQLNVD